MVMETMETGLDPSESLKLISDTIGKTKENIKEHSFCFMLWGWLIAVASFSFYILHSFTSFRYYFLPFPILAGIGILITISYYLRSENLSETFLSHYLKRMWIVLGICFILVVVTNIIQGYQPFTYTILIGGIGTLVSGLVLKFRPLIIGGILFLMAFILSSFVSEDYRPLIQGIAVVCGYLIPGYLLQNSKA
jgi:hypothetical protein